MTKCDGMRLAAVRGMACAVCGRMPCEAHHIDTGMGRRKDHQKTIPLCLEHHRGESGINGGRIGRKVWQARYGTEKELLAQTNELLEGAYEPPCHVQAVLMTGKQEGV